ncbi:MAG: hypothetical protein SGILL_005231 [Bacillariaceae sp.]
MKGAQEGTERAHMPPAKTENATTSKTPGRESPSRESSVLPSNNNTGNDRVTIDKPKRPLVGDTASTAAAPAASQEVKSAVKMTTAPPASSVQNNIVAFPSGSPPRGHYSTEHAVPYHSPPHHVPAMDPYQHHHMPVSLPAHFGKQIVASLPPPTRPAGVHAPPYAVTHPPHEFTDEEMSANSDVEDAIRRQRAPLADKFAPYIAPSDTCLEDARHRLRIALDQTRQLRAAFTERVYGKYRVCLKPPPQTEEIIEKIEADPRGMFQKIHSEIRRDKAEKEVEKKVIQKLNNEATNTKPGAQQDAADESMDAADTEKPPKNPSAKDAESADQLMYVSAGLSLIVLPEANASQIDMSMYRDRGPVDLGTGNRAKGLSSSSASAGEIILDRARRALTMKVEREERDLDEPQSAAAMIPQHNFDSIYSKRPNVAGAGVSYVPKVAMSSFSASGNQRKTAQKQPGKSSFVAPTAVGLASAARPGVMNSAASAKAIRARVQATMSMNTLLSLNPIHEELRNDTKYSASTLAMMELGVGNKAAQTVQYHKNTPHRFKHPFPDSPGGRRRDMAGTNIADLVLPPAPTYKDRRQYKSISTVSTQVASSLKAKRAIGDVLEQFGTPSVKKRRITEIEFSHGLSSGEDQSRSKNEYSSTLALNVMKAVGLVASSTSGETTESVQGSSMLVSSFLDLEKMKAAGVTVDSGPMSQSVENLKALEWGFSGCSRFSSGLQRELKGSNAQDAALNSRTEILHLRGGGGDAVKTSTPNRKETAPSSGQAKAGTTNGRRLSNQNQRAGSSSSASSLANLQNNAGVAAGGGYQNNLWDDRRQQPMVLLQSQQQSQNGQMQQRFDPYHQTNALQLAHQLRMSRLPNNSQSGGGDMSDYIGGLHQQQQAAYDWSAAVSSSQSLAALGLNQQQARAFLTREQQSLAHAAQHQAAVMLGGAAAAGNPYFAGQMLNPAAAAAALMGHSGMQHLQGNTQNQGAKNQNQSSQQSAPKPQSQNRKDGDKSSGVFPPASAKDEKTCDEKKKLASPSAGKKRKPSADAQTKNPPPSKQIRSSTATDAKSYQQKGLGKTNKDSRGTSLAKRTAGGNMQAAAKTPPGLQYFVPTTPAEISSQTATKILAGKFHETMKSMQAVPGDGSRLVNYVISVGTAVPIPKTMVIQRIKDRLNNALLKINPAIGIPVSSREVIAAVIMLWLWRNNENTFQKAFAKSGRIDVDSDSKWCVDAAVNKAVSALSDQLSEETSSRTVGPLTSAVIAHKNKSSLGKDPDSTKASSSKIDLLAAFLVSRSLNMTFTLNEEMVSTIFGYPHEKTVDSSAFRPHSSFVVYLQDEQLPTFHTRVEYLDDARKIALYSKSQERALLAAIVSRKATMSFSFSHSYVSAMVRAGEALGHGSLFEAVQNENYGVSTMIPYDVFTDESYAWEDPCRPSMGFTEGLTGDEMMRRAHARAMIQKSLKKLQERHSIKGGTPQPGPYVDQSTSSSTPSGRSGSMTPRGSSQRRRSFSENHFQQGSGSAAATTAAVYDPKHACPPLQWVSNVLENTPYGRHNKRTIPRSLSVTQGAAVMRQSGKGGKGSRQRSSSRQSRSQVAMSPSANDGKESSNASRRSTREIPWKDVASIFQPVQLPGTIKEKKNVEAKKLTPKDRTIFAPVVKSLSSVPFTGREESSDEEDISDEAVLARHQVVLNEMKIKLVAIQESRKKSMDRRKSRGKTHK